MAVEEALTVIEIVAITISLLFVITQFLVQSISKGRISTTSEQVFNMLLVGHLGLVVAVTFAGIHAVQRSDPVMTAAINSLVFVLIGLSYGSSLAILEIKEELDRGPTARLDDFHDEDVE